MGWKGGGLGKNLRSIVHPRRADVPIFMGAEGPKNVALASEIADGWLPLYYSPFRQDVYKDSLGDMKPGFEIAQFVIVNIADDVEAALAPVKAMLGFYIGGMGAKKKNFHVPRPLREQMHGPFGAPRHPMAEVPLARMCLSVLVEKVASDSMHDSLHQPRLPLAGFFFEYLMSQFGLRSLAEQHALMALATLRDNVARA